MVHRLPRRRSPGPSYIKPAALMDCRGNGSEVGTDAFLVQPPAGEYQCHRREWFPTIVGMHYLCEGSVPSVCRSRQRERWVLETGAEMIRWSTGSEWVCGHAISLGSDRKQVGENGDLHLRDDCGMFCAFLRVCLNVHLGL